MGGKGGPILPGHCPQHQEGLPNPWGAPNHLTLVLPRRWPVPAVLLGLLLASPGRDGCWVSRDRHTRMPGYGGPDAPGRVSTPFLPPPLSLSASANPVPGRAGRERVSVVLSLSFTLWQQGQGCLSPPCPHLPPNPPPGSWGSPTACPSPAQTLLRVWMWYQAGSSHPVPVTAPCPAPVPSVPLCGRVGVLPLGSWLCFPAVCACVSRPPLIPTPHLEALQRASGAGDPPAVHRRSPPQPPGTSCSRWHTNPLGAGIPAGGQPL